MDAEWTSNGPQHPGKAKRGIFKFPATQEKPTPGLEPGTPSLRETPEALAGDHEWRPTVTDDLQMRLFREGPEEQP
jgi:hypothetical protein